MDIMACTTCFGPSGKKSESRPSTGSNDGGGQNKQSSSSHDEIVENPKDKLVDEGGDAYGITKNILENRGESGEGLTLAGNNQGNDVSSVGGRKFGNPKVKASLADKPEAAAAMAAAKEATERGDMTGMCPPSRLGLFYEFFSLSHLTPPISCE